MAINKINVSYPNVLRKAGVHQTDNSLIWVVPGYRSIALTNLGVPSAPFTSRNGARLKAFELQNRTAATTMNLGIGFRWSNIYWQAGRYDGTTYTILPALQTTAATAIQVTGADQTGFVVLSDKKFDWVSGNVTTAETDAGGVTVPDHVLRYSNALGTGWITITTGTSTFADDWTTTNAVWTATAKNFVWAAPADWGRSSGLTGLPDGYYALHFQSADREASDVAALVSGLEIGSMVAVDSIAASAIWETEKADYDDAYAEALVAFFGTADGGNRVIATVEVH